MKTPVKRLRKKEIIRYDEHNQVECRYLTVDEFINILQEYKEKCELKGDALVSIGGCYGQGAGRVVYMITPGDDLLTIDTIWD